MNENEVKERELNYSQKLQLVVRQKTDHEIWSRSNKTKGMCMHMCVCKYSVLNRWKFVKTCAKLYCEIRTDLYRNEERKKNIRWTLRRKKKNNNTPWNAYCAYICGYAEIVIGLNVLLLLFNFLSRILCVCAHNKGFHL